MIAEPFATGDSWVYRIDPRIRLAAAILYSAVVAVATQFGALFSALGLSMLLMCLACLPIRMVLKRLLWVNSFILLLGLIVPLTMEGRPLFNLGPLTLTYAGVILFVQIALKSNAIVMALMAMVATMPVVTLGHTLNRLYAPDKIVHLLLMTYRYIFVIEGEYLRLARALKVRGFRPKTGLHTYRTYAYLIGMIFIRAAARAERVHQAMQCRGFKGRFYCLHKFTPTPWNWGFGLLVSAMIMLVAFLNWRELFG